MNEDKVGRDIRAQFERSYRAPVPGFDARMRAGVTGAPRIAGRPRWALGLVAVILAVATVLALTLPRLLSMAPTLGNRTQGVIPWLQLPAQLDIPVTPSPTPVPLPSGTPPCTSAQIQIDVLGHNGAGGHVFQSFGFSGIGTKACFLQGTPAIALFDGSGRLLRFKFREPFLGNLNTAAVLVEPGPLPDPNANLKRGQAAMTIEWLSRPDGCPVGSATTVHIAVAKITLPAGGVPLTIRMPADPGTYVCGGLGVGKFDGPAPSIEEPPLLPLPAISLKVPSTVHAGGELIYQVTLTNGTSAGIDLIDNCPNFGQELFPGNLNGSPPRGVKPLYQLNCKPAGTIEPGVSLTFEIRLAIPRDSGPGTYTVFFALFYWNERTDPASSRVTIE